MRTVKFELTGERTARGDLLHIRRATAPGFNFGRFWPECYSSTVCAVVNCY